VSLHVFKLYQKWKADIGSKVLKGLNSGVSAQIPAFRSQSDHRC